MLTLIKAKCLVLKDKIMSKTIGSGKSNKETTSQRVASIASQALRNPASVTKKQIQTIAASVLTQAPDKPSKTK
jgi:hypothetical protein